MGALIRMFSTPAYAQAATGAASGGFNPVVLLPYALLALFAYFLLFRPQQQAAKRQKQALDALKKGDEVVTAGGLVGRVFKVGDTEVELELGPQLRVRAIKSTLAEVRPFGSAKPAND